MRKRAKFGELPNQSRWKIVFFQHQATPKKSFPNSSLWIYEATCLSGICFFYLQRWIAKLPLPKFKGSHLSGLAGQPWDCFKICLYLFDCGEVFWRKMWLRKIRDRNPHGVPKKWRKGAGHILRSLFLLLGLDPVESFRNTSWKMAPKWDAQLQFPSVGKFTKKKTDSVEPMFLPLIFFTTNLPFLDSSSHRIHASPPRDMHQDISPAVFGYNDWSNRCSNINLEASRVNATPSGCFS